MYNSRIASSAYLVGKAGLFRQMLTDCFTTHVILILHLDINEQKKTANGAGSRAKQATVSPHRKRAVLPNYLYRLTINPLTMRGSMRDREALCRTLLGPDKRMGKGNGIEGYISRIVTGRCGVTLHACTCPQGEQQQREGTLPIVSHTGLPSRMYMRCEAVSSIALQP